MFTGSREVVPLLLVLFLAALVGPERAGARHLHLEGKVRTVLDGDTIRLETGERVRYLGIDAPEVEHQGEEQGAECYGEEAGMANAQMVYGKRVLLRYDREQKDNHGRLLAYVFTADGVCVNLELVRRGYAWVYRTPMGFSMMPEFLEAQREAIRFRRGVWGNCAVQPAEIYFGNRLTWVFHRPDCSASRNAPSMRRKVRFANRWEALGEGFSPCRLCRP